MSTVRVPASLRVSGSQHQQVKIIALKKESKTATLVTAAALLTAASPLSMAVAQSNLPPLSVETSAKKKAKATAPAQKASDAAPAAPAAAAPAKDANPYADPNAPYKVDKSASGKFTQPLVNTPKTITAVPQQVLKDTAAQSIRDLARQTPGITLGVGEGGNSFGDRISIRGFEARGDIYVDGIRDPGNSTRETFAVEQIEIYKGPSSSVGGRSTTGGALNIVTKKPNEYENFYNFSQMFGTDNTLRSTLDVNQVVTPWLAVRGNLLYHQGDVAGRDYVEDERWGGFFSAAIKPSENYKVTLDYYRYRSDGLPDYGVPLNSTYIPPGSTTPVRLPWTEFGLPRDTWYGDPNRDFQKNSQDIYTATLEAKISPNVTLTSKTRYGETVVDYIASAPQGSDGSTVSLAGGSARYMDTTLTANQTDITVKAETGGLKHTVVAGIELSREEMYRAAYSGFNTGVTPPDLFDPSHDYGVPRPPRTPSYNATIDTAAMYLMDTVEINKQWFLNGGVRFDHFERFQDNLAAGSVDAERTDNLFNWHAGILYKPLPIASIYAAYGTSSTPIGSELDANGVDYGGVTAESAVLDPERATSIEIGTKWELFNRRLLATAALFQTEKENARETGNTITATGAYRIRGLELGAYGNLTDRWSVYGGLVLLDTEVTKSANEAYVGRDLANVPLTQFSLLTKYKLTDKLTVGAQAVYASEIFGGTFAAQKYPNETDPNGSYNRIPDHWRFDAMAEYKFTDNFSAQLNVVNLTDELYYDALYRATNPFVYVAPGRAGYLTLNWKY